MATLESIKAEINAEYKRINDEDDFEEDYKNRAWSPYYTFLDSKINQVLDIIFDNAADKHYVLDYYNRQGIDKEVLWGHKKQTLNLLFELDKYNFNAETAAKINELIGDEENSALTLSYGFGTSLWQLFPQDAIYVSKLKTHTKNVILAFDKVEGGGSGIETMNNIFEKNNISNPNVNSSKHIKSRLLTILARVFEVDIGAIEVSRLKNHTMCFTFTSEGKEYMLIWVKDFIYVPVLVKYYQACFEKFRSKFLICSTNPDPCLKSDFKYRYFKDNFSDMITSFAPGPNNLTFGARNASRRIKANTETARNRLWEGFGGKRKTRKAKKMNRRSRR